MSNVPAFPSAKYQSVCGPDTALPVWAESILSVPPQVMVRSTRTPPRWVVTSVENAVAFSRPAVSVELTVVRLFPGIEYLPGDRVQPLPEELHGDLGLVGARIHDGEPGLEQVAVRPFRQNPRVRDVGVGAIQEFGVVGDAVTVGVRSHVRDAEPRHPRGLCLARRGGGRDGPGDFRRRRTHEPVRVHRFHHEVVGTRGQIDRPRRDVSDRLADGVDAGLGAVVDGIACDVVGRRVRVPRDGDRHSERRSGEQSEQPKEENAACSWG